MSRRGVKGTRASTKTRRRRSRNIFERGIQPRAHAYHSEHEIILGSRVQDSDESCMKMAALANLRHQAGPQICARREASVQTADLCSRRVARHSHDHTEQMPPRSASSVEKRKRRPHVKSKNGCLTCKRRQVRCDEHRPECLNCGRLSRKCEYPDMKDSSVARLGNLPIRPPLTEHPGWLDRDSYFFNHLSCLIGDLQQRQRQQLVFGGLVLHETFKIAMQKDFVKHAICALSASHLSSLTKTTDMAHASAEYRYLAIRGLRQNLTDSDPDNLVGVLAASLVLSWQAPSSDEYTHTMQGVKSVLDFMDVNQQHSDLRSLLASSDEVSILRDATFSLPERPLTRALTVLSTVLKRIRSFKVDDEFKRGIKELSNYVSSLAMLSVTNTPAEYQLQALYPIRNWMYWFPSAFQRLAQGDPVVMLFFACYEMVHLAIAPVLPATNTPLSILKRAKIIENLDRQLTSLESSIHVSGFTSDERSQTLQILKSLMAGPRSWTQTNVIT
ncbi:hypothetical protein D6C80_04399 [Aureobasidium pullulans]|nr:hypothetical protein D6C80_04399 [Aureobasidium pullulans]